MSTKHMKRCSGPLIEMPVKLQPAINDALRRAILQKISKDAMLQRARKNRTSYSVGGDGKRVGAATRESSMEIPYNTKQTYCMVWCSTLVLDQ